MKRIGLVLLLWSLPLHLDASPMVSAAAARPAEEETAVVALQLLVDDLRTRLEIEQDVKVSLVNHNPLVMSVETSTGRTGPFVISIDRGFIQGLTYDEIEAALAHELGHVWIYTHAPFIQSERLANSIAMRVVSRSAFEPVYEKVWTRTGIKGNLIEFIGPPSQDRSSLVSAGQVRPSQD
jgi:hypothetical protein